jgi:hypothetical protein
MEEILTEVGKISQPGIHKLIREYQADLGEYIKDCYLEAYKQDCIERAKTCHPDCPEIRREHGHLDYWHHHFCTFGREWTAEDELHNQTSHRTCFEVYCNESGYENRVIWIQSPRVMKDHGHYLRDITMARVLRKQIFADYEAQGQLRIEYLALSAEAALETAHQRKMTVIFQDSGPLIKPPTKSEKLKRCWTQRPMTWAFLVFISVLIGIGVHMALQTYSRRKEATERWDMLDEYKNAYEQVYGTGKWYEESNDDHRWEALNKYFNLSMMSIQRLRELHSESMTRYGLYFKVIEEFGWIQLSPECREAVARDFFHPRLSFSDLKKFHERFTEDLRAYGRGFFCSPYSPAVLTKQIVEGVVACQ